MSPTETRPPAQARGPIPLRDFFRNPQESAHRLSPDGQYLSFAAPFERRLNVYVKPLSGGVAKRVTAEAARDVAAHFWKGGRILYAKDFGGDENFHIVSVNLQGEDLKDLTPGEQVRSQLIDPLIDDEAHIIVSHNRRDAEVFDVYSIDVVSGEERLIAQNPGNITGWMTDHAGRLRVAIATDGVNQTLLYRDLETDPFKPVVTTNFKEILAPLFFTFDDEKLFVASNRGRDKAAIFIFNPRTALEEQMLFEHPDVDVWSMLYSRKRKVLTAIGYNTWKTQYHFLDAAFESMFLAAQRFLPDCEISFTSQDRAENKFIVVAASDKVPGKVYLFDRLTQRFEFICAHAPWMNEAALCDMKPIEYRSRDGRTIHGYLTLPKSATPKSLPVVINPHGGPWHRDSWHYNPEVQFLANRGYAVLQMNFRGSTGYGRDFYEASFKQWGRAMQDDITDGVNWLIQAGIADAKRIAIYGGSYGGYAVLSGITSTPDLYAAAIDYVGVSNLFTFIKTIPPYWKPMLDMLYEMVGHPEHDQALLAAHSPALHADQIKTPLFIAQGANDPRVNKAESDQMVAALRQRGVEVEYLVKDNEGHGFGNEENRFEFYEAMEKFLSQHIGPAPA